MMAIPVQHCTTSQLKKALVARGLPLPTNLEHAHFVQSCVEQGITQLSPSEVAPGRGAGTAAPTGRGGADRKRHYVTVLLVAMWYVTSVVAIVTCKTTLTKVPVPGLLCVVQLATATMLQSTILGTLRARRGLATREPPLALGHEARVVRRVGLSYSLGFALTNFAFSIADASAVETVKSTEPLSTVVLAAVVLSEREHLLTYVSLLPTVLGVAMASFSGGSLGTTSLLVALASNVAFSTRSVLVKLLKRDHPTCASATSDLHLFYHVSRVGALAMLPLAAVDLWIRAPDVWAAATSGPSFCVALLANGLAHATYNQLSFIVLSRVSTASHAVLNIFRRVVLIVVTVIIFGTPVNALNCAGVALAAAGALLFARSKHSKVSAGGDVNGTVSLKGIMNAAIDRVV